MLLFSGFVPAILALPFLLSAGCHPSSPDASYDKGTIVTGTVYAVGHEPFVRPAVRLEDGTMVLLRGGRQTQDSLFARQGKRARVVLGPSTPGENGLEYEVSRLELIR